MNIGKRRLDKLLKLAHQIKSLKFCGPSDDPDEQTSVISSIKFLAINFVGIAKKIKNPEFQNELKLIDVEIETLPQAYDLYSYLNVLIEYLNEIIEYPIEWENSFINFIAVIA